jgi:hypothetical protein
MPNPNPKTIDTLEQKIAAGFFKSRGRPKGSTRFMPPATIRIQPCWPTVLSWIGCSQVSKKGPGFTVCYKTQNIVNMTLLPTGDATRSPAPLRPKGMAAYPLKSHGPGLPRDPLSCLLPSEVGVGILDSIGRRIHYGVLLYGSPPPTARLVH